MALYAFDGTGNEDGEGDDRDSNVLDFFRAYQDPNGNDDPGKPLGSLYVKGIGTRAQTLVGDKCAEAFGIGGHRRVRQMIDRLENNIEHGDVTVDVIGFSRGAALALSFGNEVAKKLPRVSIRFMGIWDGGGGNGNRGLNWIALNWLYRNAIREGLPIDLEAVKANLLLQPLPQQISAHKVEVGPPRHIFDTDLMHLSVRLEPGIPGRPQNTPRVPLPRLDDAGKIFEPV